MTARVCLFCQRKCRLWLWTQRIFIDRIQRCVISAPRSAVTWNGFNLSLPISLPFARKTRAFGWTAVATCGKDDQETCHERNSKVGRGGQCACSRSIRNPVGNVQEKCFCKCSKVCDFQMPPLTDLCAHLQDLFDRFNRRVFSRIRGLSAWSSSWRDSPVENGTTLWLSLWNMYIDVTWCYILHVI